MIDFIKNNLKIILAAAAFTAVIIFFTIDMKPFNDFKYHLLKTEIEVLSKGDIPGSLTENSYIKIKGEIDFESIVMHTNFSETKLEGLTFRLEKFPKNLLIHLRQGKYFEELKKVHDENAEGIFSDIINKDEEQSDKNSTEDDYLIKFSLLLLKSEKFEGRLYKSDSITEPFSSYYYKDDLDIEGYFSEMEEDFSFTPAFLEFASESETYWILAADEIPSSGYIGDTNFPVFVIILIIGTVLLVILIVKKRKKSIVESPKK